MPTKKSTRSCAGAPFLTLVNSLSYRQPSLWRKKHNQFRPRKGPGLLPSAHLPTKNQRLNSMLYNTKLPHIFPGLSRAHQNPGWRQARDTLRRKKTPGALARSRQRKAGAAPPAHSQTQAHIVLSGREKTSQSRRPRLLPCVAPRAFSRIFCIMQSVGLLRHFGGGGRGGRTWRCHHSCTAPQQSTPGLTVVPRNHQNA